MSRDDDWALLCEYTQGEGLRKHMLAVEATVRAYARKLGEDEEKWGTVGLLHDFYRIDDTPWPVQAGVDGYVLSQASRAPVPQGLHILVVANEAE